MALPIACPIVPLGTFGDWYFYDDGDHHQGEAVAIHRLDHGVRGLRIIAMFDWPEMRQAFPGRYDGVDIAAAAAALMEGCRARGEIPPELLPTWVRASWLFGEPPDRDAVMALAKATAAGSA